MIRGVAFDFDCTLYNRLQVWERLVDRFIIQFNEHINQSLSKDHIVEILQRGDTMGIIKDSSWQDIFAEYVKMGLFSVKPEFDDFFSFITEAFPPAIVLYPDTLSCMETLRKMGLKTAILTNGRSDFSHRKISATGVDHLMDYILCSGDIGIQKPDKRAFEMLCDGWGLMPEETIFVGDHPLSDVYGAQNAGMTAIWMANAVPWPSKTDFPPYTIKSLSELINIIPKIMQNT